MPYVTGTAANYRDLVGKLRDFLTADSTLVAARQNWSLLSGPASGTPAATDELVFSGPGLSGTDDIRVGVKFHTNAGLGYYNVGIVGLTSSGVNDIENQPGNSGAKWMLLLNSPMDYWFIANGRCFKVIVRAGSNYPQCYAGFILPEHLPDDWPYPLFVGATTWDKASGNSRNDDFNRAYWNGSASTAGVTTSACGGLCDPGRVWRGVANGYASGYSSDPDAIHTGNWYDKIFWQNMRQSLTNQPILTHGLIFSRSPTIGRATYGRFDGVYYLPAFGVVPEQIITVGGVPHLAIPNVFRTTDGNFCAYALN